MSEGISPKSLEMFFEKVHLRHLEYGPALLPDLGYCCIQLLGSRVVGSTLFIFWRWDVRKLDQNIQKYRDMFLKHNMHFSQSQTASWEYVEISVAVFFFFFEIPFSSFIGCRLESDDLGGKVHGMCIYLSDLSYLFILRLDVSFQHHCR